MKTEFFVEFAGKQISKTELEANIKKAYKEAGNKAAIKSLEVYVKPEENNSYYVVNGGEYTNEYNL